MESSLLLFCLRPTCRSLYVQPLLEVGGRGDRTKEEEEGHLGAAELGVSVSPVLFLFPSCSSYINPARKSGEEAIVRRWASFSPEQTDFKRMMIVGCTKVFRVIGIRIPRSELKDCPRCTSI